MKFYGHGIVWDKEKGKALCRFENGEYETDDKRVAKLLSGAGFDSDGAIDESSGGEIKALEDMTVPELKEFAKERNIEGYSQMLKDELLAVLGGE